MTGQTAPFWNASPDDPNGYASRAESLEKCTIYVHFADVSTEARRKSNEIRGMSDLGACTIPKRNALNASISLTSMRLLRYNPG
jgi:hypothetical protein